MRAEQHQPCAAACKLAHARPTSPPTLPPTLTAPCAPLMVGKGGGADLRHALAPLRVRSSH
eukprot:5956195-Prymnesium_polylepis.1